MERVHIREAEIRDAGRIAPYLRRQDHDEIEAFGLSDYDAIRRSIEGSVHSWIAFIDGRPAAIWGICTQGLTSDTGSPWLVTTGLIEHNRKAFMRESQDWVKTQQKTWAILVGFVDARYTRAIRWLKWLEFGIGEPVPLGPHQVLFCRFEIRGN